MFSIGETGELHTASTYVEEYHPKLVVLFYERIGELKSVVGTDNPSY